MVKRRLEEPLIRQVGQAAADSLRKIRASEKLLEIELTPAVLRKLKRMAALLQDEDAKEEQKVRSRVETYFAQLEISLGKALKVFDHPAGKPVRIELTCSEGHTVEWTSPNRLPPDAIASKLKRAGWRFGRHPKCPEHNGHVAKPERTKQMPELKEVQAPKLSSVPTPAEASEAARMAKRFVMGDLETHFDDAKGRYKPGHSDATVAKSAGVSEDVVKRLRIEFYGDLREPNEIEEFRELVGVLSAAQQRARQDFEAATQSIQQQIEALRDRISQIVRLNNWRS